MARKKKPRGYWTEERVREEASKYNTKYEFDRGSQSAYKAALRLGLIDDLFENVLKYWDEKSLRKESSKYNTKYEFVRGSRGAYQAALRLGLIDDLFENVRKYWDKESILKEASKYNTKKEFHRGSQSAYNAALRLGLLDDLFENVRMYWDKESIRKEASKYNTKHEFERGSQSAYQAAWRLGLLDDLGFVDGDGATDNDCVYIWQLKGERHMGCKVYKVGITSHRLEDQRIKQVAKGFGVAYNIIKLAKVKDARVIETKLLTLGYPVIGHYSGTYGGGTEIVAMTDYELALAIQLIEEGETAGKETTVKTTGQG